MIDPTQPVLIPDLCVTCRYAMVHFKETQTCYKCGLCGWCGTRAATDAKSRRCALCVCRVCKTASNLRTDQKKPTPGVQFSAEGNLLICAPCWAKENRDKACVKCRAAEATIWWRSPKRALLCEKCAWPPKFSRGAKYLPCSFCENSGQQSRYLGNGRDMALCCGTCRNTTSCFENKCSPTRQCADCAEQSTQADEDRHTLNDVILFRPQGKLRFYLAEKPSDRRRNRSQRPVGLEWEIAGLTIPGGRLLPYTSHKAEGPCPCVTCYDEKKRPIRAVADKWNMGIVRDGSLPPTGFEITTQPAAGDHLIQQVEELHTVLRAAGAYATVSCGTHIHVDGRDFAYSDVRKLVFVYSVLEPGVLRTQPASRVLFGHNGHVYARPCAQKYIDSINKLIIPADPKTWYKAAKRTLNNAVYGEGVERPPKGNRYHDARYNFVNLHAWYTRGTFEIRGHSGTTKKTNILIWSMMWANIIDAVYEMPDKDAIGLRNEYLEAVKAGTGLLFSQNTLIRLSTRNSAPKAATAIERYLRIRWREFQNGYERSGY